MTAPVAVSERDLRTLLGIVSDDRGDLAAAGLPLSLLAEAKYESRSYLSGRPAPIFPAQPPG